MITIQTLTLRELPTSFGGPAARPRDSVFELSWPPLPRDTAAPPAITGGWAVLTDQPDRLPASLHNGPIHTELATLSHAPQLVIWALPLPNPTGDDVDPLQRVHTLTAHTLTGLQDWLARPDTAGTHLVILTRHGVSTSPYDPAPELAHAAAWALIHTAQNEHPGRITLIDTDDTAATEDNLVATLSRRPAAEPQLALRDGVVHIPRLTPTVALTPPTSPDWELATTGKGDLSNLALVKTDPASVLAPGQIRVQVRAAGLNFRDVVVALGVIADDGLGGEAAGVILDTAPDVTAFRPGDAVMGLFPHNAFAPTAITDHRMVAAIPPGWSFAAAASVPVAFVTAYIALVELGGLGAGQRVLIHAGAGGVGQAAIQIAGHLGAEVFATAHPHKHPVLENLGVPHRRIASSRSLDFAETFRAATGGHGMDVVLEQSQRRLHRRFAAPAGTRRWMFCRNRQDRHPLGPPDRRNPPRGGLPRL